MKRILYIFVFLLAYGCNPKSNSTEEINIVNEDSLKPSIQIDTAQSVLTSEQKANIKKRRQRRNSSFERQPSTGY